MRFSLKLMSFCVLFSSCRFMSWDIAFCKGPYMSLKGSVSGYFLKFVALNCGGWLPRIGLGLFNQYYQYNSSNSLLIFS